jgi:hypothetical protein
MSVVSSSFFGVLVSVRVCCVAEDPTSSMDQIVPTVFGQRHHFSIQMVPDHRTTACEGTVRVTYPRKRETLLGLGRPENHKCQQNHAKEIVSVNEGGRSTMHSSLQIG